MQSTFTLSPVQRAGSDFHRPEGSLVTHRADFVANIGGKIYAGRVWRYFDAKADTPSQRTTYATELQLENGAGRQQVLPESAHKGLRQAVEIDFMAAVRQWANNQGRDIVADNGDEMDRQEGAAPVETVSIKIEMNWQQHIPILLEIVTNGDKAGRDYARAEIMRLAKGVDDMNASDVIAEYPLEAFGCNAAGAIVLHKTGDAGGMPYVVHFRNDADSERTGKPCYYHGDYCATLASGYAAFADKIRRYIPQETESN